MSLDAANIELYVPTKTKQVGKLGTRHCIFSSKVGRIQERSDAAPAIGLRLHIDKMPELRFAWSGLRVRGGSSAGAMGSSAVAMHVSVSPARLTTSGQPTETVSLAVNTEQLMSGIKKALTAAGCDFGHWPYAWYRSMPTSGDWAQAPEPRRDGMLSPRVQTRGSKDQNMREAPKGRQGLWPDRSCRPFGTDGVAWIYIPWADAHGYIMSPLRGWGELLEILTDDEVQSVQVQSVPCTFCAPPFRAACSFHDDRAADRDRITGRQW